MFYLSNGLFFVYILRTPLFSVFCFYCLSTLPFVVKYLNDVKKYQKSLFIRLFFFALYVDSLTSIFIIYV